MHFSVKPGGRLEGRIRVPGDKSISHRSIILGSIADGQTQVKGFLEGEDTYRTMKSFRQMGVKITDPDEGHLRIQGVGMRGLKASESVFDVGNSGTSMRLMTGILSAQKFDSKITGDKSLIKRPMSRIISPLSQMGAVLHSADGYPPINIKGGQSLEGIHYEMPIASAQVKSSILLAGLFASGQTSVSEPAPTRNHTEAMLEGFGYSVLCEKGTISIKGGENLMGTKIEIPADISSAAFFMVGASIAPGSNIIIEQVGLNPTRNGVVKILKKMGANISIINERKVGGEAVGDLRVRHARLKGIEIPEKFVPLAIDELPAILIAAACAEGRTVLRGAEELRVKESDRIESMAEGLSRLGVANTVYGDGIEVIGGMLSGGTIDTYYDHRIAMSFSMAALKASGQIKIMDCGHVATSFPGFATLANKAGLNLKVLDL